MLRKIPQTQWIFIVFLNRKLYKLIEINKSITDINSSTEDFRNSAYNYGVPSVKWLSELTIFLVKYAYGNYQLTFNEIVCKSYGP